MVELGVDGVGDVRDVLALQQEALPRQSFQPAAACHKADVALRHPLRLLPEHFPGKVVGTPLPVELGTVEAAGLIACAVVGIVADAREGPHVVHCPHDGFARSGYLAELLEREHALVHPVQVDDVRLLEFRQLRDVDARVGDVHLEQVVPLEAVGFPDDEAFPDEAPHVEPRGGQLHDIRGVGLPVAHEHLYLYAAVLQCFHQATCRNRRTARLFRGVDDKYSHRNPQPYCRAKVGNIFEFFRRGDGLVDGGQASSAGLSSGLRDASRGRHTDGRCRGTGASVHAPKSPRRVRLMRRRALAKKELVRA